MRTQRGADRRQRNVGLPPGQSERRCGADRRRLHFSDEAIAEMEARLAALERSQSGTADGEGSGWDKLIIPLK